MKSTRKNMVPRDAIVSLLALCGPHTAAQIVSEMGYGPDSVRAALKELREAKRVYVARYHQPPRAGYWRPVYAACVSGTEQDAAKPPPVPPVRTHLDEAKLVELRNEGLTIGELSAMFEVTESVIRYALDLMTAAGLLVPAPRAADVLALLLEAGKKTRVEIQNHFGGNYTQAGVHIRELRLAGKAFICEWREHAVGRRAPVFAARLYAEQRDAPEPIGALGKNRPKATLEQRVERGKGLRKAHVQIAQERAGLGPWAGL